MRDETKCKIVERLCGVIGFLQACCFVGQCKHIRASYTSICRTRVLQLVDTFGDRGERSALFQWTGHLAIPVLGALLVDGQAIVAIIIPTAEFMRSEALSKRLSCTRHYCYSVQLEKPPPRRRSATPRRISHVITDRPAVGRAADGARRAAKEQRQRLPARPAIGCAAV